MMSSSESPLPSSSVSMRVVDVSGQSLAKVSQLSRYTSAAKHNVAAIIADGNNLMTLQGIQHYPALIQLSARDNSLVRMESVAALTNLVTLNLQNNSLTEMTGLESLVKLQWLCLSGNSLRALSGLSTVTGLSHLDLSDNCITELTDISMLNVLKTLLLHGNAISSLLRAGDFIPSSVETLSLAENEVEDLTQVSRLSSLKLLSQLSLMNNPCVSITDTQMFDCRPYVLHWCPKLTVLDGMEITPHERHLSESLFPPNQPHPFSVGQHNLLVQYLSSTGPLSSTQSLVAALLSGSAYPENQENINPNNLSALSSLNMSSISELEEMIKGAHPSSLSSSSSDLMQKLKALQLIEQMISTQERLLSERHDNRDIKQSEQEESRLALLSTGNDASPLRVSTHRGQQEGTAQYTLPSYLPQLLKLPPTTDGVDDTFGSSDMSQSQGVGGEAGRHGEANGHQGEEEVEEVRPHESRAAVSHRPSLKEKREEQLRLLNEKIAQRHSKLPRKTELTSKTAHDSFNSSSGASRKTNSSARKQLSSKSKPANSSKVGAGGKTVPRKTKGPAAKIVGKSSLSSKSAPSLHGSKSIASSSSGIPPSHVPLSHDPPLQAPPTPHLLSSTSKSIDQSTASPQLQHQINTPQMKSHDPSDDDMPFQSVSYSQVVENEEMTAATNSSGLLDSTSYLIPVEGEGEGGAGGGDETLMADISAMTEEDITSSRVQSSFLPADIERADPRCEGEEEGGGGSLASTLTQAYGFSTTSDFLSTLASPLKEQHGSLEEDPSADSAVNPSGSSHAVQASLFVPPSATASVSTMMVDKAAAVIQVAWRSFQARKREEKEREREVVKLPHGELSSSNVETCVSTMYTQLQKCREELAHQAGVIQGQEETIQSLVKQVELLLNWKTETEAVAKIKAATLIQKYWRGYRTRKLYPRICHGLPRQSLGATWAALRSLTKRVEEMSVALSSAQDVYGTREKFQSRDFPEVHLPSATNLQLTHFSSTCVLLHWTPAALRRHSTALVLQGYRVYVNGMPEGMVGPSKAKAYIEGLDPKTTYRITVRAVYDAGESCDSNPIIASLDPHSSSCNVTSENTAQKSTSETTHVLTDQSNGGGEENTVTAEILQQAGRDIGSSTLQSSLALPLAGDSATKPGSTSLAQTEIYSSTEGRPLLLPPLPRRHEKDNNGQPPGGEEHSLSDSTMSDPVVSGGDIQSSPSSSSPSYQKPGGEKESCSVSLQPTPTSHTEIGQDGQYACSGGTGGGDGGGERNGESEAQLPSDFDSAHLFQLVPKGHHITDETVSVMSNATEEYIGGSSSRDTLSHDRSLTSMIFEARDSASESELSDNELGDECVKKLDQSIEQIHKSYISQLPPQSSHASTSQEEEEEEEGEREDKRDTQKAENEGQLHCFSIPVHHSHDGMINTDIPSAVPARGSINVIHESDSATLETISQLTSSLSPPPPTSSSLPTFGIPMVPHPSPLLFDRVSSAASSKRTPPSLHPLSDIQLQGELHRLALATTTSQTPDPDILTTGLGSTLQTDTYTDDTTTSSSSSLLGNKALGRPKETLPKKFSGVAIGDGGSDVSHSWSCGAVTANKEPSFPLSLRPPSHQPVQPCQEGSSGGELTVTSSTPPPLGSQITKPEAFHVAKSTQESSQLLLGSALEAAPSETAGAASTPPNNHRIPTRDTGDFKRDENFQGKPSSENIESDASPAVRAKEDSSEGKKRNGMNKLDLETATGSADVEVLLPSQLGEGFDRLQHAEKLPSAATNVNLISSPTHEIKTSLGQSTTDAAACAANPEHGTGGVTDNTTSQTLPNNPQIPVSREHMPSAAAEKTKEAVCTHNPITDTPTSSASSALLASLLLSQLESDLNTA